MIDFIDKDLFEDAVNEVFSVLHRGYIQDCCRELLPRLQETFEMIFDSSFIILDTKTGRPVNVHAVLNSLDAAEAMLKVLGEGHEIGYLLRHK